MGAKASPQWDGSFQRPLRVFELIGRIISPGCLMSESVFLFVNENMRAISFETVLLNTHEKYKIEWI